MFAVIAYLLGSIPFGKIAAQMQGVDIQRLGSGNIGFSNVLRVLGWKTALPVLAGDIVKGFVAVALAVHSHTAMQTELIASTAVLGHVFPVWLKFKGGKGIATGLGATLAIDFYIGLIGLATYLLGICFLRKSGLSSLLAAWILPVFFYEFHRDYFVLYVFLAAFVSWTHRNNIREFLNL